ncbi:hypothetical protein C1Y63_08980 [Corynebacterium sp. 13CS0277]|uniref:MalY/PatB family protein n=1 Tax=Corynebacterium sp. 13CS0277 TaxID=2071994 RepID=UPI000D02D3EA|nr:aminotransferase class I/II-fold pyridoxal phosphate-dependent enzyme [Corynebacterium sp. 13CS0277]PRQ10867.1 hypothetical protein C1Y63_08980 [Corynebacterium sp. 13CS0277]
MLIPDRHTLARRATEKWSLSDPEMLPMFVAESDFATHPEVAAAIADAVAREQFGYPVSGDPRLGEAYADFAATRYGWEVNPEWVFPIADVVRGLWMAVETFTAPGTAVAFATPAYPPFFTMGELTGRETVTVPMAGTRWDLAALEEAFTQARDRGTPVGALLLCHPHNPLGTAADTKTLRAIAELAARFGVRVISDEIHAPLVYGRPHIPAASVSDTAARVTVTLTAASKAWNVAGLKCAQLILSNPEDARVWAGRPAAYWEGYSILGYEASVAAYRADQSFLAEQLEYLEGNFDELERRLPQVAPGVRFHRPEATYVAWLDFRDTALGVDAARLLEEEAKVKCSDGRMFTGSEEGAGFVRMNLACARDTLALALDRIARLVEQHTTS